MADPITTQGQQNPAPGANGQAPAAASQPAQGAQGQEPAWFTHVPEQYREEAKKGWMLNSDYTKKTMELSEKQKQWEAEQTKYKDREKYESWWQQFQPTYEVLQKNWDKIAPILSGQVANNPSQAQPQQNNGQSSQNYFENYDVLPAEEQAKRVADYTMQQHVTQALAAQEAKFNQLIAQKEQQMNNYLAVLTEGYGRKIADPTLDLNQYIAKATELSYGKFNPMEVAYQSLTEPQRLEKMKQEWMAKGREEAALEFKNSQQSPGAFNGTTLPNFKRTPLSKAQVSDAVRQEAINKGYGW